MYQLRQSTLYTWIAAGLFFVATAGALRLSEVLACTPEPVPFVWTAALNLLMIPLSLGVLVAIVRGVKPRVLLRAGEQGLYVSLSRRNRGIIPWRNIAQIEPAAQGREIVLHLLGSWDTGEGGENTLLLDTDAQGRRIARLPLGHRVRDVDQLCRQLRIWKEELEPEPWERKQTVEVQPMSEAARRRLAGVKGVGGGALLGVLIFLRSKLGFLTLLVYLLIGGYLAEGLMLPRVPVLVGLVPVCLLLWWLTAKLLNRAVGDVRRRKEAHDDEAVGL